MILIKEGNLYTMAGNVLEKTDLLIRNGKIEKIGRNIVAPLNAKIIDARGKYVTPGFIDPHSHLGMNEDSTGSIGVDSNEYNDPITPQVRAIDAVNPMDKGFKEAIAAGITTVMACPGSGNPIGGMASVIKTYGNVIDDMIIKEKAAMKVAFGENPKNVYGSKGKSPASRMGVASLIRESLYEAREYMDSKEKGEKIKYNSKLEALIPVLRREIPIKAHAHRTDDILTALRIANEFDLDITLDHCSAGHLIVDKLVKEGKPAIIGPTLMHRTKFESKEKTFDTYRILNEAGVKIAITMDAPVVPVKYLTLSAGMAMKYGLKEEEAFKAITIYPAEIMGLDERIGSLEVGKDADIVIFDGHPIKDITNQTLYTIIDGRIVYQK